MRASTVFTTLIFCTTLLAFSLLVGVIYTAENLPGYASGIAVFVNHWFLFESLPFTILPTLRFIFPLLVASVLLLGLMNAVYKGYQRIRRSRKQIAGYGKEISEKESRQLQNIVDELELSEQIRCWKSDNLLHAFTAGLFRPKVYVSSGLVASLSPEELKSVLLHEKCHVECRHTLKLFLIEFLADWLFFLPILQWVGRTYYEMMEKMSDETVVCQSGEALSLARTVLKVSRLNCGVLPADLGLSVKGSYSLEKRIRHLLGKDEGIRSPSRNEVFWSLALAVVLFVPFFHRTFFSSTEVFNKYKTFMHTMCEKFESERGEQRD